MDDDARADESADENELTDQELDELLQKFVESFPDPADDQEALRRGIEDIKRRLKQRKRKSGEPKIDRNHFASS